jgi:hypothetical protein
MISINDTRLQKKITAFNKGVAETLGQDMALTAKRACFYAMEYTLPVSSKAKPWPMEPMLQRIEDDVKKAYPSTEDPRWGTSAYQLIKTAYNEDKAKEFMSAYMGKPRALSKLGLDASDEQAAKYEAIPDPKIMVSKMRKLPKKTSNESYKTLRDKHTIRRRNTLRLAPDTPPLALVESGRRSAFIERQKKRAGLAKASWYAAFSKLMTKGGQRNYTKAKSEEGRFVWPKECRRLQNLFGVGIGNAFVSTTGTYGRAEISSSIRYIEEAFGRTQQNAVIKQTKNAMRIIFGLRYKNRRNLEVMLKVA